MIKSAFLKNCLVLFLLVILSAASQARVNRAGAASTNRITGFHCPARCSQPDTGTAFTIRWPGSACFNNPGKPHAQQQALAKIDEDAPARSAAQQGFTATVLNGCLECSRHRISAA